MGRGDQEVYTQLLDAFNARGRPYQESVNYLIGRGFTSGQAKTAVYVYLKGGPTRASVRREPGETAMILDGIGGRRRRPIELIEDLMDNFGYGFRQAQSAVYKYRKDRGLIA